MFRRQREGSIVCPSCGRLVGVRDEACFNCGMRNPSLFGFAKALRSLGETLGFDRLILGVCAALYIVSLLLSSGALAPRGPMGILAPSWPALFLLGGTGAEPVFVFGRWWTPLSAGWLHGGLLHIGFNLLWLRNLAPTVAHLYGPGRLILIYLAGGAGGFLISSTVAYLLPGLPYVIHGAVRSVGASASLFGLFGALICYGERTGQSGMRQVVWGWVAIGVVFGVVFPGIDNWAHAGGFASGWLAARWLDPLRDERPGHLLAALVGLALSLAAVLASVVTGWSLVRG
jgi:rhomboid protease GluP